MKNVEFLTGTQISTRDGSEIDFDLTYKYLRILDCSACVRFEKPNKSDLPPSTTRASPFHPRYISAFQQRCQPHPSVPNLAASTFTFGALSWRYRELKFKF
jgi:hypothetical protein